MNDIDYWNDKIDTEFEFWDKTVAYQVNYKEKEAILLVLFTKDECVNNRVFMFNNNIFYNLYSKYLKIKDSFKELLQDNFTVDSVFDLYDIKYGETAKIEDWEIKNIFITHIVPEYIERHNHFNGFDG